MIVLEDDPTAQAEIAGAGAAGLIPVPVVLLAGGGRSRGHRPRGPDESGLGLRLRRRPVPGDARRLPLDPRRGASGELDARHADAADRRDRHRQGAGGTRDPRLGRRSTEPFFAVNCAAIPADLAGSELLGHRKGAFSGADRDRLGALRASGRGVLFLDEVGDLPPGVQGHLLRGSRRAGSRRSGPTSRSSSGPRSSRRPTGRWTRRCRLGTFRADLYFRLAQVTLPLPALRERTDDLPLLVRYFLGQAGLPDSAVDDQPGSWEAIRRYDWPGNLRELRAVIERLALRWHGRVPCRLEDWLPVPVAGPGRGIPRRPR